jgi:hypothetical protein
MPANKDNSHREDHPEILIDTRDITRVVIIWAALSRAVGRPDSISEPGCGAWVYKICTSIHWVKLRQKCARHSTSAFAIYLGFPSSRKYNIPWSSTARLLAQFKICANGVRISLPAPAEPFRLTTVHGSKRNGFQFSQGSNESTELAPSRAD